MDRTERLLDLIALLLDAQRPLSWQEIRDAFPDEYSGSDEAAQRKFERDKSELVDLGLPLTWVERTDEEEPGYVLDREAYYLPAPGFSPEELAVLYAAGSAALASGAFPGRQDLAHALRKVGFYADGPLPAARVRVELGDGGDPKELPARLELLWGAITARKSVVLDYFSPRSGAVTTRTVNPWGLALRRGTWNLVGWCHLRQAPRTFHVHRVRRVEVNPQRPKVPDFEVPADFRLDAFVASWPWEHRFHEPLAVTVRLAGELVPLAAQLFPGPVTRDGDACTVALQVTDLDGCLGYVASLGADATVLGPERAVARHRQRLETVLAAHGGAP
jgi:proteasome accessory factor B